MQNTQPDLLVWLFNFASVVLAVIVGMLIGKYFPAYMTEKGRNLATKEDIAEITARIENVKSDYAKGLEKSKSELGLVFALKHAFQDESLTALKSINVVLNDLTLYCWGKLAEISGNEHYVWQSVAGEEKDKGLHYFRVAIDRVALENHLYITSHIHEQLSELSDQVGLVSNMELALSVEDPDPVIVASQENGYGSVLTAVNICRDAIKKDLGVFSFT